MRGRIYGVVDPQSSATEGTENARQEKENGAARRADSTKCSSFSKKLSQEMVSVADR